MRWPFAIVSNLGSEILHTGFTIVQRVANLHPDGKFTVFAPTDAAFDLIDADALSALLADTEALTTLLTTHVIAGSAVDAVTAYSLNGTLVETLSGKTVKVAIEDGSLRIQGAKVISSDIYTTNGIIHVIDRVITDPASE